MTFLRDNTCNIYNGTTEVRLRLRDCCVKLAASLLQLNAHAVLPKRKMANCCVIFSATVVCLAAFLLGMYYRQVIPEGLPDDQHFSARLYGASWDIFYFMVSWCPFDRYNYASKLLMINFAGRVDGIT